VIAAHEVLGIPLIGSTHPVAAVPAHVQESADFAVSTAAQQYRIFSHVRGEEIVRMRNLAVMAQVEPTARKDSLQLLLVDLLGGKDLTVEQALRGIDQSLHLTNGGRCVHRDPAPMNGSSISMFFK
jgi:hypothetical protein